MRDWYERRTLDPRMLAIGLADGSPVRDFYSDTPRDAVGRAFEKDCATFGDRFKDP